MCKGQKKDEMDSRDIQDCILIVTEKKKRLFKKDQP